ncbi:S8 family serine peptidase [Halorussus limi]|uniref:S8 family serine peptidase n=1 Tax=Halorussus limi TaxID=2938695 RepID=A0A8U0HY73_9EURY|nr:S8 family serine peptidase [Halorussus limi]UPV75586.1 S8 family serine peptidase [Halorussus limi]
MRRSRTSAVALSVLLVVSAVTAAVPASVVASIGPLAVGTASGNTSGNTTTVATTTLATTTATDTTRSETTTTATTTTDNQTANGTTGRSAPPAAAANPKVSSALLDEVESAEGGPSADSTGGTEFVQVVVRASPGRSDDAAGLVGANGGDVQAKHERLVQARVPAAAVQALADSAAVEFVRRPRKPDTNEIVGEGLSNMDVGNVHDAAVTGENVTVAVVDTGFNVTNPEISDQLVNWRNFSSADPRSMSNQSGEHGTATAELVADTAPNASIVAVKVGTLTEFYEAVTWIDQNTSTDVVTMSLSWYNVGPLDGTDSMNREINESVRNGTTWLTSSGNDGYQSHWNDQWSDPDGNGWMNFSGSDETMNVTPAGGSGYVNIDVSWNDWDARNENYDFYLYNASGTIVAGSQTVQNGSQPPVEEVSYYATEPVFLGVYNRSANGSAKFDAFFRGDSDPEYWTSGRSVTIPGTGRNIVTVGAVNYEDNRLEGFSSRGPTIDGRIKPDVVAPDGVTTSVYDSFYGTSASTPYTAGVAALMLAANGSLTPEQVQSRLESSAVPLRGSEPNNRTGYGLVDADGAIPSVEETVEDRVSYSGTVEEADGTVAEDDEIIAYRLNVTNNVRGRTDGTGAYSLSTTGVEGKYAIGYYQDNFSRPDSTYLPLDGSPDLYNLDIVNGRNSSDLGTRTLPKAHVLNVTVVDQSGDPVPNANVEVMHFRKENGTWSHVDFPGETRSDGTFTAGGTPGIEVVGDVRVMASPPDGSSQFEGPVYTDIIDVQNDTNVTVTLQETVNVSGRITGPDGNPVDDGFVYFTNESADQWPYDYTNATGNFTVEGVHAGRSYDAEFFQDGADSPYPHDDVPDVYALGRVNATTDADLGRFDLPNASLLNVRVVDEVGNPVENATVNFTHSHANATARFVFETTDAEGYLVPRATGRRGMEFAGDVSLTVTPPENSTRFPPQIHTRSLTMSGDQNVTVALTTSAPIISAFDVTATGQDVNVSFESTEQLSNITVGLDGDASGTLTRANFTETNDSGTYVYTANVSQGRDGTFEATLQNATDGNGNDGATGQTDSVIVDTKPPEISANLTDATDDDGVVNDGDAVRIEATVVENGSGVASVTANATSLGAGQVDLRHTTGDTFAANVTVADAGTGTRNVTVRATDNSTNTNSDSGSIDVDNEAAHVQKLSISSYGAEQDLEILLTTDEELDTLRITLTNSTGDTLKTIREGDMSVQNDSTSYEYRAFYTVDSDDEYQITLEKATDTVGNENFTGTTSDTTVVDTTAPTVSVHNVTSADGNAVVSDGERVSVAFNVSDALTGVESVTANASELGAGTVALTQGDDGIYRGNFTVDAAGLSDGTVDLFSNATDTHGNSERLLAQQLLLDTHAPNATATLDADSTKRGGWYNSSVAVNLSASDGTSRLTSVEYRVDGGDWQSYEGNVTVSTDGNHSVSYRATDAAGNVENRSVSFKIDATDPATDLVTNASANDNGWYDSDVNVTFDASDETSGVAVTNYSLDGGQWQTYDGGNVTLDSEGNHTVEFYSVDEANNTETHHNETIRIDTEKPSLTTPPGLNRTDEVLPQHAIQVVVNATDDQSRVHAILVDGESIGSDGHGPVLPAPALGNHEFEVVVRDAAGNELTVRNASTAYNVGQTVAMNRTKNGTLEAETSDTNVNEVSIRTDNGTTEANVTVGTATTNPDSNRTNPNGTSLYFPQIDTSVSNANITDATVNVTVEQSRVHQKYIRPGTVKFWVEEENRSTGWEKVDAKRVDASDDDGTYTYKIEAPHFSTYAITGRKESTPPTASLAVATETPTPGEVTLTGSYDDDYSGVDPANVTLTFEGEDGVEVATGASIASDGQITFTRNLSAGTYNATLNATDNAGNSLAEPETVSFAVVNESSGNSGGGGSAGGGGGAVDIPVPDVRDEVTAVTPNSFRGKILSARSDAPGRLSPEGGIAAGDLTVRQVSVRPSSDEPSSEFYVDASVAASPPDGATAPDVPALGYVEVGTTEITASELSEVGVKFAVPASAAAAPENVALYRLDGGSWRAVETEVVETGGGKYVLRGAAADTGTFAVGVRSGALSVTDASVGATTVEPGESVTVTATVENDGSGTASGTARLSVDGDVVAEKSVELAGGESERLTFEVTLDSPGEHELAVNGASAGSVSVAGDGDGGDSGTTTAATTDDGGSSGVPGFGVSTALVALLAGLAVARRRLA